MKYHISELPEVKNIKKVYFVGIKGVGMAPIALIARGAGLIVAGSDIGEEFITDKYLAIEHINISVGFETTQIKEFFSDTKEDECLLITTGAHKGFDNPQVIYAKEMGITVVTQGQALSLFMEGKVINKDVVRGIAVAGSHGKTTISSLLATSLKAAGFDPTYSVGTGEVFPLGAPGYFGRGELFVAEADEYSSEPVHDKVPKFLYQTPYYAIFNNIDFDHPDLFSDIDDVVVAFTEFSNNIKSGGTLFVNGDDERLVELKNNVIKDIHIVTYGQNSTCDYVISRIVAHGLSSRFTVHKKGEELGVFELNVPGAHNAKNSLAVIAFLSQLGLDAQKIRVALSVFTGTKRRSEMVGLMSGGCTLIDDYGHHPLEISTTITSIKQAYPDKKLVCVFQSHTYSRTKSLLSEFGEAFSEADKLLLLPIFKSQRDTEKDILPQEEYIDSHKKHSDTEFFENFSSVVEYCRQNYNSSSFVILTIGAGDIYKVAYALKENG